MRFHMITSLKPGNGLCAKQRRPSVFGSADEMSSRFDRTIIVQIVVTTVGKPHKLFRLMGEREQLRTHGYRNCGIARAVHDQKRSGNAHDALVRPKLIPYQPTNP